MNRQIIAIAGQRGHGKTTAAQALEQIGWRHINFADTLKEAVELVYGIPVFVQNDPLLKEKTLDAYPFKSPREILQQVGTEMFRSYIDDTWIQAWSRRVQSYSHIVCSDLRFPNEAALVKSLGGVSVRIVNPSIIHTDAASKHASETYELLVDVTIMNDGTVADLHNKMKALIDAS